jgi:3-dehydroquinate dehydratase/shikimate dehydrogenase
VELDIETAKKVPRFGDTKRVVSYTSLDHPLSNVDAIFEEAVGVKADVVKFTWPTPTLDAAWPLLVAVSKKSNLPAVGIGLGPAGVTFSLLGRRYGSPWIYAALEKGMEAHSEQNTVWELDEIFGWSGIGAETRFVGVIGTGRASITLVKILNRCFQEVDVDLRCLPLELENTKQLGKMLEILKIKTMVVNPHCGERLSNFADHIEDSVQSSGYADLLLKRPDGWHAYNCISRAVLKSLETALGKGPDNEQPLDRRNVLLIGGNALSKAIAHGIIRRQGVLSVTGPDDKLTQQAAKAMDIRYVPFANLYDTLADVVVIADDKLPLGHRKQEFNSSYLRPHMTVLEFADYPLPSVFTEESRVRNCQLVGTVDIFLDQLGVQFKSIVGQELPRDLAREILSEAM